jgi:hypothetical protein
LDLTMKGVEREIFICELMLYVTTMMECCYSENTYLTIKEFILDLWTIRRSF